MGRRGIRSPSTQNPRRSDPTRILTCHHCPYERLAEHARIRTYLVVLAEHLATERLDALAHRGAPHPAAACRACC
ncbi:three-helix bundle dimerization domain-containing protein [Streptomyces anandii]|uniref:three-helix bundle dimerization domain-containing protein n=1 Tax=Streptomyces anandii TaxID=285454 RepID=UPI00379C8FA8